MNKLQCFLSDESGVSAMEYALIAAFVAVVIISAVTALGTSLQALYNNVAGKL